MTLDWPCRYPLQLCAENAAHFMPHGNADQDGCSAEAVPLPGQNEVAGIRSRNDAPAD